MYEGFSRSRKRSVSDVLLYTAPSADLSRNPSATSASRKSAAEREWSPRRCVSSRSDRGPRASSVNSPSSTALSSALDAQNPRPVFRIRSALSVVDIQVSFSRPGQHRASTLRRTRESAA